MRERDRTNETSRERSKKERKTARQKERKTAIIQSIIISPFSEELSVFSVLASSFSTSASLATLKITNLKKMKYKY